MAEVNGKNNVGVEIQQVKENNSNDYKFQWYQTIKQNMTKLEEGRTRASIYNNRWMHQSLPHLSKKKH